MSGECNKERYNYCPTQELVIKEVLQTIAKTPEGLTRCEIEEARALLLHGAIAQALCDLLERGDISTYSKYYQGQGWLTVWVMK